MTSVPEKLPDWRARGCQPGASAGSATGYRVHPSGRAKYELWRLNTSEWAMRGRLGAVSAIVIDGETASRRAKNGPPARDAEQGGLPPGRRWSSIALTPFLA
jgi:hypothetical protein